MVIYPKGTLLIVVTENGLGMLLEIAPKTRFQHLSDDDVILLLEDMRHEHVENIWQYMRIFTRLGYALAPAYQLRNRAQVLVKGRGEE